MLFEQRSAKKAGLYHSDADDLLAHEGSFGGAAGGGGGGDGGEGGGAVERYAQTCYLFNPYTLLCCVSRTSTVMDNLLTAAFILALLKKNRVLACAFLAAAAYKVRRLTQQCLKTNRQF